MERTDWDTLHMTVAYAMAMRSPDPSTQVGAVIVAPDNTLVATGYNGWPRGVEPFSDMDARWLRPTKYLWMAHAERNAIDNAARTGAPLKDCTLYSLVMPCADCARGIVQVGIKRVVCDELLMREFSKHMHSSQTWVDGLEASRRMFNEAGVKLDWWTGHLPNPLVRLAGEHYSPIRIKTGLKSIGPVSADKIVGG